MAFVARQGVDGAAGATASCSEAPATGAVALGGSGAPPGADDCAIAVAEHMKQKVAGSMSWRATVMVSSQLAFEGATEVPRKLDKGYSPTVTNPWRRSASRPASEKT